MNIKKTPRLYRMDNRPRPQASHEKIVLIHGMGSSSEVAFTKLLYHIANFDSLQQFDVWAFDYDTNQSFAESADQLVLAILAEGFRDCCIHLIGHSMGGLVARMAVLRHKVPTIRRIVTLTTPNHGAINGVALNYLGQLIALATRKIVPLYVRRRGVIDLVSAHTVMRTALEEMHKDDPSRIDGKSYISIPAQYFHTKRLLGDPPPSFCMGGVTASIGVLNNLLNQKLITLRPVHDGIVEERSNQLSPSPVGSTSEASFMPTPKDRKERILHVTHEAAADHDHLTILSCKEIADLIMAVIKAQPLDEANIWRAMAGHPGKVYVSPNVS